MRILQVFSFSGRSSGIVVVVSDISTEMAAAGDSVGWLSSYPVGAAQRSMLPAGVALIGTTARTSALGSLLPGGNWAIPSWGSPKMLPDLVHLHGIYLPPHARMALACRRMGIPYIVTPHGTFMPEAQKYQRLKKAAANRLVFFAYLRNAAAIHALGPEEAREIEKAFPGTIMKIIPNGIKTEDIESPGPRALVCEGQGTKFLFIGRLDVQHKGLDLLIEAVHRAAPVFRRSRSSLLLAGPFDTRRDESLIMKAITRSSLEDVVRLQGSMYGDEKRSLVRESDVFVHTSRYEGLPMAVLEAMALGKPCLVTPGTNLSSAVEESDAGWTTGMGPDDIADSLVKIMASSPETLRSKGEKARALIKDRFLLSKTVDRLRDLYREVIEKAALHAGPGARP